MPTYYVVLDTNVLVHNNSLLRSALGLVLLRNLARSDGRVGLPEVVEEEAKTVAIELASDLFERVVPSLRQLTELTGRPSSCPPVTSSIAANRFGEIGGQLVRFPYRDEHGREAMVRVIGKIPPNTPGKQQYKDTLLWLAILDAANDAPVHFVTTDKDFFQDRSYSNGLAAPLVDDVSRRPHPVHIYSSLAGCLREIEPTVPAVELALFGPAVVALIHTTFAAAAASRRPIYGDVIAVRGSAFDTNRPTIVALDLEVTVACEFEVQDGSRMNGSATFRITGEGTVPGYTLLSPRLESINYSDSEDRHLFSNLFLYTADTVSARD